jgi:hypothetical protein
VRPPSALPSRNHYGNGGCHSATGTGCGGRPQYPYIPLFNGSRIVEQPTALATLDEKYTRAAVSFIEAHSVSFIDEAHSVSVTPHSAGHSSVGHSVAPVGAAQRQQQAAARPPSESSASASSRASGSGSGATTAHTPPPPPRPKPFLLYFASHHTHVPQFASHTFSGTTARGPLGDSLRMLDWGVGEIVAALERANQVRDAPTAL